MVADPLVKLLEETVAVHASVSRLAVTVTEPSWPERELLPEGTEPRLTDGGTVMLRTAWASEGVVRTATAAVPTTIPMRRPILMRTLRYPYRLKTPDCQTPEGVWRTGRAKGTEIVSRRSG